MFIILDHSWRSTYFYGIVDGGNVLMTDHMACKIVRIWMTLIKTYDGVVRTFKEDQHVLTMKKNLVPFGSSNSNGADSLLKLEFTFFKAA